MSLKLIRYPKNPIIIPSQNWWENQYIYNPGACLFEDKILLLYRARGDDYISRFGKAVSEDGFNFKKSPNPCFESDPDDPYARLGVEDPRITKIDDTFYIVYCAASLYPASHCGKVPGMPSAPYRVRVAMAVTKDFVNFQNLGVVMPDVDSKDATLLPEKINGKYVLIHRVFPHMWISFSEDLVRWEKGDILMKTQGDSWGSVKIGAGTQPIKTDKGWLMIYHATDKDNIYRLGLVFLDLKNPSKILYRHPEPIFEPEESWEKQGLISNVVFTCGAIEKDNQYFIYYGAADKVIGLATVRKKDILNLF